MLENGWPGLFCEHILPSIPVDKVARYFDETYGRLEEEIFNAGTAKLAEVFKVNTDQQRINSVHIKSNMRRLGRIGIFSDFKEQFTAFGMLKPDRYGLP